MDPRRLRSGELLSGGGRDRPRRRAVHRLVRRASGWSTLTVGRVLLVLTIALALTFIFITLSARAVSMATSSATVTVVIGALALMYLLFRVGIDEPGVNALVSVDVGAYLGLLCVMAIIAGAWRALADERTGSAISLKQTERVLAVRGAARPAPAARDAAREEPRR